jgi:flagellar motor component MotA
MDFELLLLNLDEDIRYTFATSVEKDGRVNVSAARSDAKFALAFMQKYASLMTAILFSDDLEKILNTDINRITDRQAAALVRNVYSAAIAAHIRLRDL